jgi:hypothetical protein
VNFLKKLFSGPSGNPADRDALYVYVQPKRCDEIIKVRVNLMNEPSKTDDGRGYYVRKIVSATRCPFQAELELFFDKHKDLQNQAVTNGEIVSQEDYEAYLAGQEVEG